MTARRIFFTTYQPSFKADGAVNAGGSIAWVKTGTSTDKNTFGDFSLSATNSNPVTLDSQGKADIYIAEDGLYDFTITDSSGSTVETVTLYGDNLSAVLTDLSECKVSNHSFEADVDADNIPDNWTLTTVGGSAVRIVTDNYHGTACLRMIGDSSEETAESAFFEVSPGVDEILSFAFYASNATAQPKVEYDWYDKDQASVSSTTVFSSTSGNTPTAWEYKKGLTATPPSTARYAKVKLTGNQHATSYTVYFEDVCTVGATATISPVVPRGLTLSNNGVDAVNDIDIAAGEVRDSTNAANIIISATVVKQLDAAWAEGTAVGGLASGASYVVDEIYSTWAIYDSDTGVSDIMFDQGVASFVTPTLPAGYDLKRLIGYIQTWDNSSVVTIRTFTQGGDYFRVHDPFSDLNDNTISNGVVEEVALTCPPLCLAHVYGRTFNTAGVDVSGITIKMKGADDTTPNADGSESILIRAGKPASGNSAVTLPMFVFVDADSKVEYAVEEPSGTATAVIKTYGCLMLTRSAL